LAGDGGLITTNDPGLADRLAVLRDHGSRKKYHYDLLGMNSRLDSLQAAILLVKLRYLEQFTQARQRNAGRYAELFEQAGLGELVTLPVQPREQLHVYNQYVIRTPKRDQLREHLRGRGIPTEIYYPAPLHLQPAFAYLGYGVGAFPQAEKASQQVLALPIFPQITREQQQEVVEAIADFLARRV
jgi:dTDP-4-amino-4,6-dideoxygalactose transaminase